MAFSKDYLSVWDVGVCNDVDLRVYTVNLGDKLELEPDEAKTRICITTSKVQVTVDKVSFKARSNSVFMIRVGKECVVRHLSPRADSSDGAIIHVLGICGKDF